MGDYFFRAHGRYIRSSVKDKEQRIQDYVGYMLSRTQQIFTYSGLPDTIPQKMVELYLQTSGFVAFAEIKGDLYAVCGGLGGEPDAYYRPTILTVANPYLDYSASLKIGTECEVVLNDSLLMGLLPMYYRYAEQMVENDLTIYMADINTRLVSLLSAADDNVRKSAMEYLEKLYRGELGIVADSAFLEGIKTQPYASGGMSNQITQLIELQQYLKASWYNDIGLQSNYNMKRESINSNEAQLNEQSLLPLIDDMLACRRDGLERVNKMFGLNITVELASSWAVQHNEMSMSHDDDLSGSTETPEEETDTEEPQEGEEADETQKDN